jgi:anti-sigma factor RsiW
MDHRKVSELIPSFHDGQLPARLAAEIRAHLPTCPECRAELASLGKIRALFPRPEVVLSAAFTTRVMARLEPESEGSRWSWLLPSFGAAVATLALIIFSPRAEIIADTEALLLEDVEQGDIRPAWTVVNEASKDSEIINMALEAV